MSSTRSEAARPRVMLGIGALFLLSACAMPLSVTAISLGANGLSYATSGKSMTDNYLSYFTSADCALSRIMVQDTPICITQPDTALAEADGDPAVSPPIYPAGDADDAVIFSGQ